MTTNIILNTDSYKASHWLQMPPGSTCQNSYIESRGGKFDKTVFFGLQIFLQEYLSKPITMEMIDEAEEFLGAHGEPFNREGWEYILERHNGYLPLRVEAVDEGTVVPVSNVMVQVRNTDPKCYWLTSYIETALLRAVWYPTTVATLSYHIKKIIEKYLDKTADDTAAEIMFKLHDFGARGVSSYESAGIGGASHLVNFMGTDTITGALFARRYYDADMAGFSIPASEHSTVTSWGDREGEIESLKNMLDQFGNPGALLAFVSDSYDIYNMCENVIGGELKEKIIESGATLVVRPDSGDPVAVTLEVVKMLGKKFGYTLNSKGYKVLPACIRVIQGDGVNIDSIEAILANYEANGWSASNIAFGQGGALLQQLDRDTQKFAMKCSALHVEGEGWRDVYKQPLTDPGKNSKRGILELRKTEVGLKTERQTRALRGRFAREPGELKVVFLDGKMIRRQTFDQIRAKAAE